MAVAFVRQDAPETFRNVAKSSETVGNGWTLLARNDPRRRKFHQAGIFVDSHSRRRRSGCDVAAAAFSSVPGRRREVPLLRIASLVTWAEKTSSSAVHPRFAFHTWDRV